MNMEVILYMAMTANGLIAKENDDTSFVSKVEWKSFRKIIKRVGNMVIGRRTYEIMHTGGEFSKLGKIKIFVMTHDASLKSDIPNITFTTQSPQKIIELIQGEGFNEALVAGGGKLNSTFMKENIVDELYLDVEPFVIGKGIHLFEDANFERKLRLIGVKKISNNEVQLHYKVLK